MNPQIITVDSIQKSIEDIGVEPFANSLVQEMGGDYFYVEAELQTERPEPDSKLGEPVWHMAEFEISGETTSEKRWWLYRVWPVPIRLAWFVVDTLKLKGQIVDVGNHGYDEGRQRVYIPAGVEIFGKKVKRLTKIPAEMRPIVVDKL